MDEPEQPYRIMQRNPLKSCTGALILLFFASWGFLALIKLHPEVLALLALAGAIVTSLVGARRRKRAVVAQPADHAAD